MKKVICLLMLIMFIPSIVMADAGGPSIIGYDAIVINKNGIVIDGNKIPYNQVIHIVDELVSQNDDSIYITIKDKEDELISGNVLRKDIIPYKEEIKMEDIKNNGYDAGIATYLSSGKIIVYENAGVKLSKGPANLYEKYDVLIPYGKELKYIYVMIFDQCSWYFVDDDEYHGWISTLEYDLAYPTKPVMVFADTKMVDDNNNVIATIPKGTLINEIYDISNDRQKIVYYNNQKGYVNILKDNDDWDNYLYKFIYGINYETQSDVKYKALVLKDFYLNFENGKKIDVKKGEIINIVYGIIPYGAESIQPVEIDENHSEYYIEYQGVQGFVDYDNLLEIYNEDDMNKIVSFDYDMPIYNVDLYKVYNDGKNVIEVTDEIKYKYQLKDTIKSGTKIQYLLKTRYFDTIFYFIKYNNDLSVIIDKKDSFEKNNDNSINNSDSTEKSINNIKNTILYGISGAIVLAFISLVIIKAINKKKNNKNNIVDKGNSIVKKE